MYQLSTKPGLEMFEILLHPMRWPVEIDWPLDMKELEGFLLFRYMTREEFAERFPAAK
jgi:hypothetical protein